MLFRSPPFVSELLDAAVEEVWWKSLPMAKRRGNTCFPFVVLEWPSFLAGRSTAAPPGVPTKFVTAEEAAQAEGGAWMNVRSDFWEEPDDEWEDTPTSGGSGFVEEEKEEEEEEAPLIDPWEELPVQRSIITVVRAKLVKTRATHVGTFNLIHLPSYEEGAPKTPVPLEE